MLSHESLVNFYKTNFALMQYHKYSLTELENQLPFEREIYIEMLIKHLDDERAKAEQRRLSRK
jgi:hypothetical protein